MSRSDKIIKSIRIIKKITSEYKYEIESMIYAFADKFLTGKELDEVKVEIAMTELGKMLIEDGIKKGREEGEIILLLKLIKQKFQNIPVEYIEKIRKLDYHKIDQIASHIFEIKTINELENYIK